MRELNAMRDDEVMCDVVPLRPDDEFERRCVEWVKERVEWDAFEEVSGQYFRLMEEAMKSDDVWEPIRVMARAEKLMRLYISMFGHDRWLPPLQRQLQDALYIAHRKARRVFIRAALTGRKEETPYDRDLESGKWDGRPDTEEDRRAVERHLNEGRRLFEGLYERSKVG
jgi:hypothetical protein